MSPKSPSSFGLAFALVTTVALGACDQANIASSSSTPTPDPSVVASARPLAASAGSEAASPPPSGPAPSAHEPPKLRDAEKEVATIAPFDEAAADPVEAKKRVRAALAICGDFREPGAWGRDSLDPGAPPAAETISLCPPATAAKLLVLSADLEAKEDAESAKRSLSFALALDPTVKLPSEAPAPLRAAFAEAKKRKPGSVRFGAITTTDAKGQKSLEGSLAPLLPHFRACYTMGLLDNPDLQGRISISAVLSEAGRVLRTFASGDIPDGRVVKCTGNVLQRAVLARPDKAPARIAVPLVASP